MTDSEVGHNMLVEQVLRLVHYLAKHGFYGDMEDIKQLLDPLLSLLDGTNDLPHPNIKGRYIYLSMLKIRVYHHPMFLGAQQSKEETLKNKLPII